VLSIGSSVHEELHLQVIWIDGGAERKMDRQGDSYISPKKTLFASDIINNSKVYKNLGIMKYGSR